jgi:alkaline phosphatase D
VSTNSGLLRADVHVLDQERRVMHRKSQTHRRFDRRSFFATTGGIAAGATLSALPRLARAGGAAQFAWPYTLGVASGDPLSDAVVIWTRLAPAPQDPGGGMPSQPQPVCWEVARDEHFHRIECSGETLAWPEHGHSVHVDVRGLDPARTYWYRFTAGGHQSPIGRTRTAPRAQHADRLRFAFASCQHFETGYYTAYQHMAEEDLDLVVFLGDYMYEGVPNPNAVRSHTGVAEPLSVDDYRARYANYRSDQHLQRAHALFPWIVTFDDHEVDNNWSADIPQDPDLQSTEAFLARRAAAFQAYYEHMPLRRFSRAQGSSIQLYRRLGYGGLAKFHVLDTRQFRSVTTPCGYGSGPDCPAQLDPTRTMLGDEQDAWLLDGLHRSRAHWNILAQQVPFGFVDVGQGEQVETRHDKWDAYPTARQRVLDFMLEQRPGHPVVITGDLHNAWVQVAHADPRDPESTPLASEFVGSSISSGGDGTDQTATAPVVLAKNPQVLFNSNRRGYVSCLVTPELWRSDFRAVPYVSTEGAPVSTIASYVLENGNPVPYLD